MKLRFWGTRGSLPATVNESQIRTKIRFALERVRETGIPEGSLESWIDENLPFWVRGSYGTNTTCLEVDNPGGALLIFDAGSGLRDLGSSLIRQGIGRLPQTIHFFMTHLHWDHLQGFPFFAPAYMKGREIIIHTYHAGCEAAFRQQMQAPVFPVPFDLLGAQITFDLQPPLTPYLIEGFEITTFLQRHPGDSYAYRFSKDGQSFVLSTDSEHKADAFRSHYPYLDFVQGTDVLIFDAQYSMADATFSKADWGHSSNVMGVELAARAGVKRLVLCHHDPLRDDESLGEFHLHSDLYREMFLNETHAEGLVPGCPAEVILAYDGLELTW